MSVVEAAFVGVVLVMMLTLLFLGWKTPEVVVFLALVLVWNAGIISTDDALSGFNNPGVLAVGSLFVVIKGVERSKLADKAAKHVFGLQTSFTSGLLRLMSLAFLLSAFLNNTPVVALLIPITKDWASTRGFSPSLLLMPLSFACIFGGLVTIIGTSTNLVVQGLVIEAGEDDPSIEGLGFFEPGLVGLPLGLVGMAYLVIAAPRILPKGRGGAIQYVRDKAEEFLTEVRVVEKFRYIGKPVALVLAQLSLPAKTLIKIRRKAPTGAGGSVLQQEEYRQHGSRNAQRDGGGLFGSGGAIGGESAASRGSTASPTQNSLAYRKSLWGAWGSEADDSPRRPASTGQSHIITPPPARVEASGAGSRRCPAEAFSARSTPEHGVNAPPYDAAPDSEQPPRRGMPGDGQHAGKSYTDLCPVSASEPVQDGDVIFLSCPLPTMTAFLGSAVGEGVQGLEALETSFPHLRERRSDAFFELVLSDRNHFVGRRPSGCENALPCSRYGCRVVAVRHTTENAAPEGDAHASHRNPDEFSTLVGNDGVDSPLRGTKERPLRSGAPEWEDAVRSVEVAQRRLAPGDVVLVLAEQGFVERWKDSQDFDLVTRVGCAQKPVRVYDYFSLLVFCGMLGWVLCSSVIMARAAFVAGGLLMVGGWVDSRKAVGYVDWALLLLVGSALGLSKAISNSGLAGYAGNAIRESGMSASASLYVLYGFTMMCTELITNNAAAALAVPVALSIAKELEVSYKPFVLTVMLAASSSFITPIGYQTNTMVWAPGGYKFSDFIRLGTPLSLIYLVVGSFLMPRVFPF